MIQQKAILGITFLTAVTGGAGLGGYYGFSTSGRYIHELIKEEGSLELLNSKDVSDSYGKAAGEKYRTANKNDGKLSNWESVKSLKGQNAPQEFLDKCGEYSNFKVKGREDDLYIQVSKGCTRKKKVVASSLLAGDNKTLLTSTIPVSDKAWKDAGDVYRKEHNSKAKDPWVISGGDSKKNTENADAPNDFVTKCATEASKMVDGKEDPIYQAVLKYCTKDG